MRKGLKLLAVFPLVVLLGNQSCKVDLGNPEAVRTKMEQSLRPYFPRVKAFASPERQMIVAFTCVQGDGPQLVFQVADALSRNPDIQQLRTLRTWGGLLNTATYGTFALGFEHALVRYDVDSNRIETVTTPGAQWENNYRSTCGVSNPEGETPVAYVWVGTWEILSDQPTDTISDTLGIYGLNEFASHRDVEVTTRESVIRKILLERGMRLQSLRLLNIKAIPLTQSIMNSAIAGE